VADGDPNRVSEQRGDSTNRIALSRSFELIRRATLLSSPYLSTPPSVRAALQQFSCVQLPT
jgi:hypothetical protein